MNSIDKTNFLLAAMIAILVGLVLVFMPSKLNEFQIILLDFLGLVSMGMVIFLLVKDHRERKERGE